MLNTKIFAPMTVYSVLAFCTPHKSLETKILEIDDGVTFATIVFIRNGLNGYLRN
jgi:hypothetical protein